MRGVVVKDVKSGIDSVEELAFAGGKMRGKEVGSGYGGACIL